MQIKPKAAADAGNSTETKHGGGGNVVQGTGIRNLTPGC